MKYNKITQLSKGWSSYIWLVRDTRGREFVLKEVREKSPRKDLAEREGKMLSLANTVSVGPRVQEINFKENFVVMEYVRGAKVFDWIVSEEFEKVSAEQLWNFIKSLYKQLLALDTIGLSHNQLPIGKNILVREKVLGGEKVFVPVIIDFEKATLKPNGNTRNIGQIESFLFYNPNGIVAKKVREKFKANL